MIEVDRHTPTVVREIGFVTPDQAEKAGELALALAGHFDVHPAEFSLVRTVGSRAALLVMYASHTGIPLDDPWRAKPEEFTVSFGSESVDTRSDMTETAYRALIAQVNNRCGPSPDRPQKLENDTYRPIGTWLTGVRAGFDGPPFGVVASHRHDDIIQVRHSGPDHPQIDIFFRPTAVV